MKAMILAAGRGERLRPITDRVPKALVEVRGKPLIVWQIERLATAGLRDLVINASHLADALIACVGDGARFGVRVRWSREAEPLETAGGIAFARALLGPEPFVLVNADVYAEYDYAGLRARSLGARLAHLVLVPNPPHRADGDFSLAGEQLGTAAGPRYTYSGLALLSPALLAGVAPGEKAALAPLLFDAARRGQATGEIFDGLWQDVGSAERLAALHARLDARAAQMRIKE